MKISLCMIVKNEEEVLARCLNSIKPLVDEIVIADTGSTDGTVEIARSFGAKVFSFEWNDDFAAARNAAFAQATGDYLIWLDADDYVSPENAALFPALRERLLCEQPDMVMCPYDVAFDGAGNATSTFMRERILKKGAGLWRGRVHECIAPHGKVITFPFRVFHLGSRKERGARNLHIYQKWAKEAALSPRDKFYYGRELYYNGLYTEAVAVLTEATKEGWYVNKIEACKILALCHLQKKDDERALEALFQSFLYGEPRASVLCEAGNIYKRRKKLREAVFFYEGALLCRDHTAEGDFELPATHDLIPLLELTCLYYELGERKTAVLRHKKAEELFPEHPSVKYNRAFFQKIGLL